MGELYGIEHSNRNENQHWGKNCFNSSFPTSLACYMLNNGKKAIYARLAKRRGSDELYIKCEDISINEVFDCGNLKPSDLEFDFETKYTPYQQYAIDSIPPTDLVVRDLRGNFLSPLEIKLTTLPSDSTRLKSTDKWGCEIVFRYPTTSYCAMGIWDRVKKKKRDVREIFENYCNDVEDWTHNADMASKCLGLCQSLDVFERNYLSYQHPLVMQPFWRTNGQLLDEDAFDMVVWSDMAFTRTFIDTALRESPKASKMSRPMRASARMARCIWELSKSEKISIERIYHQMAFGVQNDKESMLSASTWRNYIISPRVDKPSLAKDVVTKLIDKASFEKLRPERRLDQTLFIMNELGCFS